MDEDLPGMWEESDLTGGQDDQAEADRAEADARINRIISDAIVAAPPETSAEDILTSVRKAIAKLERTVICPPELEDRINEALDVNEIHHVRVVASPYLPDDKVYIVPSHLFEFDPIIRLESDRITWDPIISNPTNAVRVTDI